VVHDASLQAFELSTSERWILDTYHAMGSVGILVLKSLAYLAGKGRGDSVQVSRVTLARHCDRSIRTVSRAIAKLKTLSLIAAEQPAPHGFDCWEPNIYRLTALGRHVAALLGTGSLPTDFPTRAIPGVPVCIETNTKTSEVQTSAPSVAHAEHPGKTPAPVPVPCTTPSCGPELEPIIERLEQGDATRFTHLRDWINAKLRAGVSRRHLREALEALSVNLERVQSWAGWVQNRLEELTRAERAEERRRQIEQQREAAWRQQREAWAAERKQNSYGPGALVELFEAEREAARAE
jgi:hypothetical protein